MTAATLDPSQNEHNFRKSGVDEGVRTLDRRSHNPELYQLSYVHHIIAPSSHVAGPDLRPERRQRLLPIPTLLRGLIPFLEPRLRKLQTKLGNFNPPGLNGAPGRT